MEKSIVWKGLHYDIEEHCGINYHDDCIRVHSEIEGWAEGKAVYVEYWLKLGNNWDVQEFEISSRVADRAFTYALTRDDNNQWKDRDGKQYHEFNGCRYIDVSLTPFTNTLPVNGLHLGVGEKKEIEVVYIDILHHDLRIFKQSYTRLKPQQYKYESRGGDFFADIDVDEDGLVTNYPRLFEMIRAIKNKPNNG